MTHGYVDPMFDTTERETYQQWIVDNVPIEPKNARGRCLSFSQSFAKEFPTFRLVGCVSVSGDSHAWCVDAFDRVVDPTAHQFSIPYDYENDRIEHNEFPVGKCMNCGELIYHRRDGVCSDECHEDMVAALDMARRHIF